MQGRPTTTPTRATTASRRARLHPAARLASSPPTARSSPRACPSGDRSSYQREYPTGDLFADVTGYFSFTLRHRRRSSGTHNDALAGTHRTAELQGLRQPVQRRRSTPATSSLTLRSRPPDRWPSTRSATARARSSCLDPRTGAILALWSYPSYDPNLIAIARLRRGQRGRDALLTPTPASRCWPTPTRSATCPARPSRSSPRRPALESGTVHAATRTSRRSSPTSRRRPPTRSRTTAARRAAATCVEVFRRSCNTAVRPDGASTLGAPDMVADGRASSASTRRRPIDLPRPAPRFFGDRRRLREQHRRCSPSPASARATTCRSRRCRWPWSPRPSPTAA